MHSVSLPRFLTMTSRTAGSAMPTLTLSSSSFGSSASAAEATRHHEQASASERDMARSLAGVLPPAALEIRLERVGDLAQVLFPHHQHHRGHQLEEPLGVHLQLVVQPG